MTAAAGVDPAGDRAALRGANRARAWDWMRMPDDGAPLSAWRLEWIKAALVLADERLTPLPAPGPRRVALRDRLRGLGALAAGTALFALYVLRRRAGVGQPALPTGDARIAALHGEWSTRTRHVLAALEDTDPPVGAILLLGRLQRRPEEVAALWSEAQPGCAAAALPLIEPMSPGAVAAALRDLPGLLRGGLAVAGRAPCAPGLRDQTAITFRVLLGAVAARWWARQAAGGGREVIFAITGTADTTLLERAIQRAGGRSVHAVHGQATGPNFAGFSDLALFRSRHDATAYETLGCYRACAVQPAPEPQPRRGASGLLLLSNLAHPMNGDFRRWGLRDETALLACAGEAARELGPEARSLLWKPHPVIAELPADTRRDLRAAAAAQGFEELPPESDAAEAAAGCRWVVTSPSTVALDLLRAGCLAVVLDPQGSVLDTALAGLPHATLAPGALADALRALDADADHARTLRTALDAIGPARALDLRGPLK